MPLQHQGSLSTLEVGCNPAEHMVSASIIEHCMGVVGSPEALPLAIDRAQPGTKMLVMHTASSFTLVARWC
jgi:hypothetical protein